MQFIIGNYCYLLICIQMLTLNLNFCIYLHILTIESIIIEVGQVVPELCHFLYFPLVTVAILYIGPYRCLQIRNLRFSFSSYPNKVESIIISLRASDSDGTAKSIYGRLHNENQSVSLPCSRPIKFLK